MSTAGRALSMYAKPGAYMRRMTTMCAALAPDKQTLDWKVAAKQQQKTSQKS